LNRGQEVLGDGIDWAGSSKSWMFASYLLDN
jgi:hypothetical protein